MVPTFIRRYLARLRGRQPRLLRLARAVLPRRARAALQALPERSVTIAGTGTLVTESEFRALAIAHAGAPAAPMIAPRAFVHRGEVVVSALASLYRGGAFIESFLANMAAQTWFDRAELIVVDAASPDGEVALIDDYRQRYPNIRYHRTPTRIGVYAAWNIGIGLARGRYLTNTNVDDLRRADSFALQATALAAAPEIGVVYQDFLYNLEPRLDFAQIARIGLCSSLPQVDRATLLALNPPHNAPMWRATLHARHGGFDESFTSAGDLEFWLRCAAAGERFRKLDEVHVAYYLNPEGVSNRPGTPAQQEQEALRQRFAAPGR